MQILKHNQMTYDNLKPYIDSHRDCCIVNPCGSGKSSIIEAIISDYEDSNILIVTKQANASSYYNDKFKKSRKSNIPIVTYTALYNCFKNDDIDKFENVDICIFDEAHYIGAQKWSAAVNKLREISGCVSIGVTATPQRFMDQGTENSIINEFDNNSVGGYTTRQLQDQGVFIEPEYIISLADINKEIDKRLKQLDNAEISDEEKKVYIDKLQSVQKIWKNKYQPALVMKKKLPEYLYRQNGNKILVFSKDTESIQTDKQFIMGMLTDQFPDKKIKAYEYSYKTSEKEFREFLSDKTNYINVLFCVNKVCETIHISDLNILIFLRSSASNRIITQQIGRINDINNKHKSLIIDMVDNLSRYDTVSNKSIETSERKRTNDTKVTVNCNFEFVNHIIHIFENIDKASLDIKYYEYLGFRGSLKQVCYVFRRDDVFVSNLLNAGYDLSEAIALAPRKKKNIKTKHTENFDFALSEKEKETVMKHNEKIYRIAESKNCKDEDIIADCQLYLCQIVHDMANNICNIDIYEDAYVHNKILQFMLRCIRQKYDELDEIEYLSHDYTYDTVNDIIKNIDYDAMREQLKYIITHKLHHQLCTVMMLKYGLSETADNSVTSTEIGKMINKTASAIRRREAKAIESIRRVLYASKKYGAIIAYYNEYLKNQ